MLNEFAARHRKAARDLERFASTSRYVDMGIDLRVVAMDVAGGEPLIEGCPPLRVLRTHRRGGIIDTAATVPGFVAPSADPVVWYCSEDQEPIILHDDPMPDRILAYGSEGAGKTRAQALWCGMRLLEMTGADREIGMTAPTGPRLELIYQAIVAAWPTSWYRWVELDSCFFLVNGTRARLVSTHQQSKAEGSRVQGFNWSAHGGDEMQDQNRFDADIEMRGRSAAHGRYRRFCTATAKDDSDWRTYKDGLIASGRWHFTTLLGQRSPFIWPSVWEDRKATLSAREYRRRVEAMDVGPERMLYHTWSRAENLRPVPQLGALDVTAEVLAPWGRNLTVLVGHDPGKLCDVSLMLKAYRLRGERRHRWWVVDELTTQRTTSEEHVRDLLERLRTRWGCNRLDGRGRPEGDGNRALVRADPYGQQASGDAHPAKEVYTTFRQRGLTIHPAAYTTATDRIKVGRIPKEARIEMVNRLICSASGDRTLFVACDDDRKPAAPRLVEALEVSERDEAGRAETENKDKRDKSHWPAGLGYALWALERPRIEKNYAVTARISR